MNAERLHSVLKLIQHEYVSKKIITQWTELISLLQQAISAPTSPDAAKPFSDRYKAFKAEIEDSPSFAVLPPSYRETIAAIGAQPYLGQSITARFEAAIDANRVASAIAIPQLQSEQKNLSAFMAHVNATLEAFKFLQIPSDDLAPGTAEVGFLIPRDLLEPSLGDLAKEFKKIDFVLRGLNELATRNEASIDLRAISSSDWEVFLTGGAAFLAVFDWALKKLCTILANLVEIRASLKRLHDSGVPKEATQQIVDHTDKFLDVQTRAAAEEAIKRFFKGDPGRGNELATHLTQGFKYLASRIDAGMRIDLRLSVRPMPENAPTDPSLSPAELEIDQQYAALEAEIHATLARLEDLRKGGGGTLKLPPPDFD